MTSSTGAAATRAAVSVSGGAGAGAFGVIDTAELPVIGLTKCASSHNELVGSPTKL